MKQLILFLLISQCLACHDNYQQLRRDITITQHFNRNEAKNLASIVEYFDEKVCNCVDIIGIKGPECYRMWFDSVKNSQPINVLCSIDKQDQWAFSKKLYKSTIEAVWTIQSPSKDGKYAQLPQLNYNFEGAYWKWLRTQQEQFAWIIKYMSTVRKNNSISQATDQFLASKLDSIVLADPTQRLILAVHVLTKNSVRE